MVGIGVNPYIGLRECTCDAHFLQCCPGLIRQQVSLHLQSVELPVYNRAIGGVPAMFGYYRFGAGRPLPS